ncbi:MAG: hypothetical protein KAT06_00695 [Gammaproteobacteria bacterium]|nr:hypothetical protein [Gammaproteobacteria bacterium]
MNNETGERAHWSFWLISIYFLTSHIMGSMNFFLQMNADMVASFPETYRAIIEGRPIWATAGFAIAIFGGMLGCLLLLFRKSIAFFLFIASMLGMLVTMIHTYNIVTSTISFSIIEIFIIMIFPLIVAVFLLWYSKFVERKGWIS